MSHMPLLRVVPMEQIRPHEEIDPLRVDRLAERIEREGVQINPVVCMPTVGDDLVLLDGATRTAALKSLGLECGVVQVVEPEEITLETWHHVVRDIRPDDFKKAIDDLGDVEFVPGPGTPRIWTRDGEMLTMASFKTSPNAGLASLVASYIGKWQVNRVIEPDIESVVWRFPDWAVLVEFPSLTIDDVSAAALEGDLLPAGITRFVVPDRALRLNMVLDDLRNPEALPAKQARLDQLITERAEQGRVRRYSEPVVILDD